MKKFLPIIVVLFAFAGTIFPQKKAFTLDDLYKIKSVGAPVLSHSGKKIAYTVTSYDLYHGKSYTHIYIMNNNGTDKIEISPDSLDAYNPFWSNSDSLIYYLSDDVLYSYSFATKVSKKLVHISSGISKPILSPKGNLVAFTTKIYPECGADTACFNRLNKSSEDGPIQAYIADSLLFRHWTQYNAQKTYHIFTYNLKDGKISDLTPSEWTSDAYKLGAGLTYNFSPDGTELCFMHDPDKDHAEQTNSDLWVIPVNGGKAEDITVSNKAWDGDPAFSADGKYIGFVKTEIPKYESDRYRVAVYNRETKQVTVLTEKFDHTLVSGNFKWGDDSKTIYFTPDYRGYMPLFKVDLDSKKVTQVSKDRAIIAFDISINQKYAYCLESVGADKPYEIYKVNLSNGDEQQLTFENKKLEEEVDFRPAEKMWVPGADGIKVEVFVIKPHDFNPSKKYPLILNVHGGPQGQWMDSFRGDWQMYPGSGYVVAFCNPHGSTGFGSAYTREISGDWGGKVFTDLMKVTDALEKLPYVDTSRVGAMGWSYGGYMMDWFQGHTKRFKCLAAMMGVYDLRSMWGGTEELWFVNKDLNGYPWTSKDYEKFSPSMYAKNFSTPTLILTGQRDFRVPYTQSIQYFTTLQVLGIPSRLIIFKNDGHWPSYVKSMPLYYNAHLEWFHKYLGGKPAPYNSIDMIKNIAFPNEVEGSK